MCWKRLVVIGALVGVIAAILLARRRRLQPHVIVEDETAETETFTNPVLIINPGSGSGKAGKIDLVGAAAKLGIETIVREKGQKIKKLANGAVDAGCDHLMIAGGDGSLARVANVAIKRGVAFSCVPTGTRNHFAMDLGLDRSHPAKALAAAFEGVPVSVDVGRINGRIFLNNVSFGVYADAIANPNYRDDRTLSLLEASKDTIESTSSTFSIRDDAGVVYDDIGMLLASNNPYHFIGAPDFAGRARLDTGRLGAAMVARVPDDMPSHRRAEIRQRSISTLVVDSERKKIRVGIDGSLHKVKAPVTIGIDRRALTVVLPLDVVKQQLASQVDPTDEALSFLSGAGAGSGAADG